VAALDLAAERDPGCRSAGASAVRCLVIYVNYVNQTEIAIEFTDVGYFFVASALASEVIIGGPHRRTSQGELWRIGLVAP
jgi:hypothetical protein